MPAAVANDATACSASCGSNAGLPRGRHSGSSTSHTTNGRPDRSSADLHQCLVEWEQTTGESAHTGLVAERLTERLAEADGDVFDRVVRVDVEVAGRGDSQVEATVLADLIEHVVVERDAGRDLGVAGAVELDR